MSTHQQLATHTGVEAPEVLAAKVRQQFDATPYPNLPPSLLVEFEANYLFIHNLVTAYYLRDQRVISSQGATILDAGCGSGKNALALAVANPGARIVGVDLSAKSVEMALERLHCHGFTNCEFHQLALEDLPSTGMQFDYINCDEVLSLVPNLAVGLQALRAVLAPQGILRANVHSIYQRVNYYAAQEAFALMGLLDDTPGELEVSIARETMLALKNTVPLKKHTWSKQYEEMESLVLMNYLLQGDRGYTIPDLFAALRANDLEFISMVEWRNWELLDLFSSPNELPAFWEMSLPELSTEDRLAIYELMHPVNRLLDFWCGHPSTDLAPVPVAMWTRQDWQDAMVHLHPQLKTDAVRQDLCQCIVQREGFCPSKHLSHAAVKDVLLESSLAAILLPLWEGAQPIAALVDRWQRIKPADPITLAPIRYDQAFAEVTQFLTQLENYLYVLIEHT